MSTGENSSSEGNKHPCSFMQSIGLNIGKESKMPCPVTVAAGASYGLLAVNMFSPDLIRKYNNNNA